MRRGRLHLFSLLWGYGLIGCLVGNGIPGLWAQSLPPATDHATSALTQLHKLLAEGSQNSTDPATLLQLSRLYLEIGQDLYQDENRKHRAFEEGARLAKQVLDKEEANAEAHYLYAANLGSAAQLSGIMASAATVSTLKTHVQRALELNPEHAPALHMKGMMLEELPWFLGGDKDEAIAYLVRATKANPEYTRARLDLAKIYITRQNYDAAQAELMTILNTRSLSSSSEVRTPDQQEAQELLNTLPIHP